MHTEKRLPLKKIDYAYPYKDSTIPYAIWSNGYNNNTIETVVFLGTVQIEKLGGWVLEACPPHTIVVQGTPHWFAESDGTDIPEYGFDFTKRAFDTLLSNFLTGEVHIVAESQAVPGVLELFAQEEYMSHVKKLTLLQPLGLNAPAYRGTNEQRIESFRRRIAANFLHQVPAFMLDARLRYNHRLAHKLVGVTLRSPKARAQYSSGLMYDGVPRLQRLHAFHKDIAIICGAYDKIFPPSEIITTLAENRINIQVQVIKGVPHSPLATRYGRKLLAAAFNR